MKGIPTTQDVKDKIVELAKMGYDRVSVADMLGISTRTASKYAGEIFASNKRKSRGIKTYTIPKELLDKWDKVTGKLRKYFKKGNEA